MKSAFEKLCTIIIGHCLCRNNEIEGATLAMITSDIGHCIFSQYHTVSRGLRPVHMDRSYKGDFASESNDPFGFSGSI